MGQKTNVWLPDGKELEGLVKKVKGLRGTNG